MNVSKLFRSKKPRPIKEQSAVEKTHSEENSEQDDKIIDISTSPEFIKRQQNTKSQTHILDNILDKAANYLEEAFDMFVETCSGIANYYVKEDIVDDKTKQIKTYIGNAENYLSIATKKINLRYLKQDIKDIEKEHQMSLRNLISNCRILDGHVYTAGEAILQIWRLGLRRWKDPKVNVLKGLYAKLNDTVGEFYVTAARLIGDKINFKHENKNIRELFNNEKATNPSIKQDMSSLILIPATINVYKLKLFEAAKGPTNTANQSKLFNSWDKFSLGETN
uniref:Uncharacterized protein n=1 Tax=uncultured bacterium contig00046 TaxID=1181532 RepID=A0A806KMV8_9BACT|nr:hypothetical protein [uncultured bacterium contig00046]